MANDETLTENYFPDHPLQRPGETDLEYLRRRMQELREAEEKARKQE